MTTLHKRKAHKKPPTGRARINANLVVCSKKQNFHLTLSLSVTVRSRSRQLLMNLLTQGQNWELTRTIISPQRHETKIESNKSCYHHTVTSYFECGHTLNKATTTQEEEIQGHETGHSQTDHAASEIDTYIC
eukprot:Blabericola_migrator_1__2194@NODE_1604_length_4184_cov_302_711197_g1013_i2_p3_GENE_NODE_1604_length_4184_cov_302_711197_g1013_i2NODE_1604_length_4184_cov_302_711197_g1013_i2_p3_ORF_typecomplete_len132_score5_25_NODE_1604_length_4184_cov_302_711197_g1013_i234843879